MFTKYIYILLVKRAEDHPDPDPLGGIVRWGVGPGVPEPPKDHFRQGLSSYSARPPWNFSIFPGRVHALPAPTTAGPARPFCSGSLSGVGDPDLGKGSQRFFGKILRTINGGGDVP